MIRRFNVKKTITTDKDHEKKANDLMSYYGHTFSSLIRYLIRKAWEEMKK